VDEYARAENARLIAELAAIRLRLDSLPTPQVTPAGTSSSGPFHRQTNRTSEIFSPDLALRAYHTKFPDPEPFDGNRKVYRGWKIQVMNKVKTEQARGGMSDLEGYIFSRLKGDAARAGVTYMEKGPGHRPGGFWGFLDAQYLDPILAEKARDKLYTFRQGKSTLTEYIMEFNRLMYEADAQGNSLALKTRFHFGLREDLRERMVSIEIPVEWTLENLQDRVRGVEENMFRLKLGRHSGRYTARNDSGDPMEDVQVKLHETRFRGGKDKKPKEQPKPLAPWVKPEVIDDRKARDACMRCGKKDHRSRNCSYSRAIKPVSVNATSSKTAKVDADDSSDPAFSEDESEN
jgi:hypothetical protein